MILWPFLFCFSLIWREDGRPEDSKRRSLPPAAGDGSAGESNPLLQLTSYDDEDEEDVDVEVRLRRNGENGHGRDGNGWRPGEEDVYSDEDDRASGPSTGRSQRLVEVRRDCPYLDTVNRQVILYNTQDPFFAMMESYLSLLSEKERKGFA
ncbi:unnamed protein product [Spirodela intermedia]|uniref:Uncharacterized protein n=1 Tax=Spirodela intermedia TaxID=51605 RepID=A0A7I8JJ15_SPIIN|nr:unnamed protein product [Spirodela intermedia]CAA6670154.1 unnamed protein product [Spirodela intermedia]